MRNHWCVLSLTVSFVAFAGTGCVRIKPDPVRVEPIHITVDVNLRVQRELANVFDDIDAQDPTIENIQ